MSRNKIFYIFTLIMTPIVAEYFEECANIGIHSFVAVTNDCRSFIHCVDAETSYKYTCPAATYFDEETGKCEFDYDNICLGPNGYTKPDEYFDGQEVMTEYIETTDAPLTVTSAPIHNGHVDNISLISKCARQKKAHYPHPKRCEYYYKCIGGYLTISRCNFYYAWDYRKKMCVPYRMAKCVDGSNFS